MTDEPADDWAEIDPLILDRQTIRAMQVFMDSRGARLRDAIEAVDLRFQHLRATRPRDITPRREGDSEAYS